MRKLKIDVAGLQVESFEMDPTSRPQRGTVNANAPEPDYDDTGGAGGGGGSGNIFCISAYPCVPTNERTCNNTCAASCAGTCAPPGSYCT